MTSFSNPDVFKSDIFELVGGPQCKLRKFAMGQEKWQNKAHIYI